MDLLRQRFHNQHLAGTKLERPEDVVRYLGAVQSQDYAGAKWSVGQRVKGATDAAVDQAFSSGRILRTHVLRPTWHFVAPDDIRWILSLTAPRVHALNAYQYRQLELSAALLARAHAVLTRALEGGNQLTRAELAAMLADAGIVAEGLRLAYVMMHAELEGLVCSGALRGKQHTYALLDDRAPWARRLERPEALAELAKRFFTSHGPATLRHFVWWSGLTVADARTGLAAIQHELEHEVRDGRTTWHGVARSGARAQKRAAFLIPEYDEALTGYRDLAVPDMRRVKRAWKDAFFRPIVIDGQRAGTWKRTNAKQGAVLETNLFASLDPEQWDALRSAASRYGKFLGMPIIVERPGQRKGSR
jgi:hypothetical protein